MKKLFLYTYYKKRKGYSSKPSCFIAAGLPFLLHYITVLILLNKFVPGFDFLKIYYAVDAESGYWNGKLRGAIIVSPLLIVATLYYFMNIKKMEQTVVIFDQLEEKEKKKLNLKSVLYLILSFILMVACIIIHYTK